MMTSVYVNGRVWTADPAKPTAEAFTVRDGRTVAVGANSDMLAIGPGKPEVVDLGGRRVLPGFVDAHAHTVLRSHTMTSDVQLDNASSVAEIVALVAQAARQAPEGQWLRTTPIGPAPDHFGLPQALREQRWPTAAELDAVAPRNPVYVPTPMAWPHPAILNSAALSALRLPTESSDGLLLPAEASGRPTGAVYGLHAYNSSAFRQLVEQLPVPDTGRLLASIRRAMSENLEAGITSIYEGHLDSNLPLLRRLRQSGQLLNRVVCTYEIPIEQPVDVIEEWFQNVADARGPGTGDDNLRVRGVTASLDGAIQFGRAYMRQPYLTPAGHMGNGVPRTSADTLRWIAERCLQLDLRLNILAAGSGAIDLAMDSLRATHKKHSLTGRRWVVQHFQHPTRRHLRQLSEMGLVGQTYASVDYSKGSEVYRHRLDGNAWESVVPLRWWFDAEVPIAQGSDGAHIDPLFQIWATLTRTDGRTGQSLMAAPKQITREQALATYTINGAHVMGTADVTGSIEPGKLADFVVLDQDILTCGVEDIPRSKVLATAIGGSARYDPAGLLPPASGARSE